MGDQIIQVGNVCPTKTRSNPNQGRVYDPQGISPTLSCMGGGNLEPHIIIYDDYNRRIKSDQTCIGTVMPNFKNDAPGNGTKLIVPAQQRYRVRKLTPKECWRLMGFEDDDFENARKRMNENLYKGNDRSSSQLYKQAGNSIVVDVLLHIMENLYDAMPYLFDGMVVGSFFSGIGAFEKALTRLQTEPHEYSSISKEDMPNLQQVGYINDYNGDANRVYSGDGVSRTLKADAGGGWSENRMVHGSPLGLIDPQGRSGKKCAIKPMCPTLRAQIHGNPPGIVYGENQN